MLIIPLPGKIDWKNPPALTLLLIATNCLVFIFFQINDDRRFSEAVEFYIGSGLVAIEGPAYVHYLNEQSVPGDHHFYPSQPTKKFLVSISGEILADGAFLEKLRAGEIITSQHSDYSHWQQLRASFEKKLSRVAFYRYGFKPAFSNPPTLLSHMFLHGGWGHLIGNMIFLWLAGCLVELGIKRYYFLPAYIFTGLTAVSLFWAFHLNSAIPLVGASGAISGVMGILTTLYGKNRINIFYSLGFYFNYITVPALILLPVWVGKELVYQFFWAETSNVAYLAHVGGFLGGAVIGLLSTKVLHIDKTEAIVASPEDHSAAYVEEALEAAAQLNISEALRILDKARQEYPDSLEIMKAQYKITRMHPEKKRFHASAIQLLKRAGSRAENYGLAREIYADYIQRVEKSRLSARTYVRLMTVFMAEGHPEEAEKIAMVLLKHKKEMPEMPAMLLKLARTFRKQGQTGKYTTYRRLILSRYADSSEAAMIRGKNQAGNPAK